MWKIAKIRGMITVFSLVISMTFGVTALAATQNYTSEYNNLTEGKQKQLQSYFDGLKDAEGGVPVTLNSDTAVKTLSREDAAAFTAKLREIKNSSDDDTDMSISGAKDDISTMKEYIDISADMKGAGESLSGLGLIAGIFVGIMAYIAIIGLTIFTSLDILYVTAPIFRNWADEAGSGGSSGGGGTNKMMSTESKSTGESKFRWITDEAIYAVKVCSVDTGKSAVIVYGGKRIISVLATVVVIFILLTGNIGLIANMALNIVAGIISIAESLG